MDLKASPQGSIPLRSTPTKYGVQPGFHAIYARGVSMRSIAIAIGVDYHHLNQTLNGVIRPRPEVKERLPQYLGVSLEQLFTPEILAEPAGAGKGRYDRAAAREEREALARELAALAPLLTQDQIAGCARVVAASRGEST